MSHSFHVVFCLEDETSSSPPPPQYEINMFQSLQNIFTCIIALSPRNPASKMDIVLPLSGSLQNGRARISFPSKTRISSWGQPCPGDTMWPQDHAPPPSPNQKSFALLLSLPWLAPPTSAVWEMSNQFTQ